MTTCFLRYVLAWLIAPAAVIAAEPAEYAIRWAQGGASTADAVIERLKLTGARKLKTYSIQYFQIGAPPALAANELAIGRLRTRSDGKIELTYKTRLDFAASPGPWVCPLDGATPKVEVDVTVRRNDVVRKLSRSCELEAKQALPFPASLKATPKGCTNTMTRTEIGAVKIEHWSTPRGTLLEVSMIGTTAAADLAKFRKLISPLLKDGVMPLDRSKADAGSEC